MYTRIILALVIGLIGIVSEAHAGQYFSKKECDGIQSTSSATGLTVTLIKYYAREDCKACIDIKGGYFEFAWTRNTLNGPGLPYSEKCLSPTPQRVTVKSDQTLRTNNAGSLCQNECSGGGLKFTGKFTLGANTCECEQWLGQPPPKPVAATPAAPDLKAMQQAEAIKQANRYTVELKDGYSPSWSEGGSFAIGGRLTQHVVALQFSSKDDGKTLTGTVTYQGEKPMGFRATARGINQYTVETQSGGTWSPGGDWVIGSRREPVVAFDAKSVDQGINLTGSLTFKGSPSMPVRMWLVGTPPPPPETTRPPPPPSAQPLPSAPVKAPTVSPAPATKSPNRYAVENVWGSDGWHPGGTWIIGGRDTQRVVEIQFSSKDEGKTLTGTMTYDGEGPIGFRATATGNNQYTVENQWAGSWHPGGTWVIGGRTGQAVVDLSAKSADHGKMLTGNMTYVGGGVGNDKIGFKAILEGHTPSASPAPANPPPQSSPAPAPGTLLGLAPGEGRKVALQSDDGGYFARCNGCQKMVDDKVPDTITTHAKSPAEAPFDLINVGNGKIALRADTGKFVARCNGCVVGGTKPDIAAVHASSSAEGTAQFTPVPLSNGKYGLKADTGRFLARCSNCSPGAAMPNTVTIHVTDPNTDTTAQWNLVSLTK